MTTQEWNALPPFAEWWWCGTCWVLEAPCLEEADMMRGALMSCDLCCYYQWDQSWKWTATCSMMMSPDYSTTIGCQSNTPTHLHTHRHTHTDTSTHTLITSKIIWSLPRNVCVCVYWPIIYNWFSQFFCMTLSVGRLGYDGKTRVQTATCWPNTRTEGENPVGRTFFLFVKR